MKFKYKNKQLTFSENDYINISNNVSELISKGDEGFSGAYHMTLIAALHKIGISAERSNCIRVGQEVVDAMDDAKFNSPYKKGKKGDAFSH